MTSVRLGTLFTLLTLCMVAAGVLPGASWGDTGIQSAQLVDVSNQWSNLASQIAQAQQHGQSFQQGQLSENESCGFGPASQGFAQFSDEGYYALPAQGDLSGWSLNNVAVSSSHDPYSQAQYSLTLAGNAQATTPTYCVGATNSAVRLFLETNGPASADLKVNLLYQNPDGSVQNVTVATLQAGTTWQPSITIPVGISALASAYPGGQAPIAFQLQPEGLSGSQTFSVDDLSFAQAAPSATATVTSASAASTTTSDPTSSASVPITAAPTTPTAPASSASTSASQLIDNSNQIANIQKQIAQLKAGQTAKQGALSVNATCGYQTSSQVFLPWGDSAEYALAAQGALAGWGLKNVSISGNHDPYSTGQYSLSMSNGGSVAVSPAMCVNLTNPTIRLFAKDTGGNGKSDLKVTVLYEDLNGNIQQLTLAKLHATSSWAPTITIPIGVNILSAASASGVTAVAFELQPEGLQPGETWSIDNLYVDPFCSH